MNKNKPYEVLEIIKRNKNLDYSFKNHLFKWSSRNGHNEVIKLLLQDDGVDPIDDNNSSIRWASRNGHLEVVKMLLQDNRVDPSAWDNYAIRWANAKGHTQIVKLLIQHPKVR